MPEPVFFDDVFSISSQAFYEGHCHFRVGEGARCGFSTGGGEESKLTVRDRLREHYISEHWEDEVEKGPTWEYLCLHCGRWSYTVEACSQCGVSKWSEVV